MIFLRSLLIALMAVVAARPVSALLSDSRPQWRRLAWVLLLAPYLTPTLLVGYAYANFSLSLVRHPYLNTFFYAVLVWLKFTPVAVLVLHFAPSPISAEAIHCQQLFVPSTRERILFRLRAGQANAPLVSMALVFLFAFAEFELASLMYVKSWTVALFDAHAGGIALSESLRQMLVPLFIQAVALALAVRLLFRRRVTPAQPVTKGGVIGWIHLIIACLLVLVVPATMMIRGTIQGFSVMLENFALGREIVSSLLLAAGATLAVSILVLCCRGKKFAFLLCFPGLLGPLVLSLAVLAAVQHSWLLEIRDTPAPLIVTMAFILLPVALVLRLLLDSIRRAPALHLTSLMNRSPATREIMWRLKMSGRFWTIFLLFAWAYWDLTASAILAPIAMTPVTVRLYNLMHYGQNAALSSMLCAAFVAPLVVGGLALGT